MFSAKLVGKQMDVFYDLYLPEYNVPTPEVQTNYIEIPGLNGSIDKISPDGVVHYKNREWTLQFQKTGKNVSAYDLPLMSRMLYNDLHGRKGEIIFDDDINYKWIGRVFVDDVRCENNGLIIADIRLITDPFRYGVVGIERSYTLSGTSQVIVLKNGVKPLVPKIVVSGTNSSASLEFTIKGNSYTASLSAGTWTVPDLVLFEGDTEISISGSGNIKFEYPEALL